MTLDAAAPDTPPDGVRLLLVAAVALIDADGRVLLARRPGGHPAWALVPWITFVIVFMVAWY